MPPRSRAISSRSHAPRARRWRWTPGAAKPACVSGAGGSWRACGTSIPRPSRPGPSCGAAPWPSTTGGWCWRCCRPRPTASSNSGSGRVRRGVAAERRPGLRTLYPGLGEDTEGFDDASPAQQESDGHAEIEQLLLAERGAQPREQRRIDVAVVEGQPIRERQRRLLALAEVRGLIVVHLLDSG